MAQDKRHIADTWMLLVGPQSDCSYATGLSRVTAMFKRKVGEMSILWDDEYHLEAYKACRQAYLFDGQSYGDILEAQGLDRHKVSHDASLNTLVLVIAESLRSMPEYNWVDESDTERSILAKDNIVYLEPEKEVTTLHGVPIRRMEPGNG